MFVDKLNELKLIYNYILIIVDINVTSEDIDVDKQLKYMNKVVFTKQKRENFPNILIYREKIIKIQLNSYHGYTNNSA